MPRELRPIARALRLRRASFEGTPGWEGRGIVLAVVGVGTVAAGAGTSRLLEVLRPARVLVVGVAGAADPQLSIGDVVAPAAVVDAASGTVYTPSDRPCARSSNVPRRAPSGPPGTGARRDTLTTLPRFGAPPPPGTTAVDMETAAIVEECVRRGVPWDVRRAISDLPGTLHATVAALVGPDGRPDLLAVARFLTHDPRRMVGLVRVARDTASAIKRLRTAVLDELATGGCSE